MALRSLGAALSRLSLSTSTSTSIKSSRLSSFNWLQNKLSHLSSASLTSASEGTPVPSPITSHTCPHPSHSAVPSLRNLASHPLNLPSMQVREFSTSLASTASLNQMHRTGPIKKKRKNKNPLGDRPYARGVVLKTLIKKPKKPNSANRKCVLVRLTTGKEMVAYIPGEGHNLQEHNIVLVQPGRLRDVPGVKVRCVRGKYDLQHVIKTQT